MEDNCSQNTHKKQPSTHPMPPDSTSERLRPVYAAYINLARLNLYSTLKYVSRLTGLTDDVEEKTMFDMRVLTYYKYSNVVSPSKVRKALFKHLPFLGSMSKAYITNEHPTVKDKDISALLINLTRVVCNLRNYYSHAESTISEADVKYEQHLEKHLRECWKHSRAKVTTRHDREFWDSDNARTYYCLTDNNHAYGTSLYTSVGAAFLICKLLPNNYIESFLFASQIFVFERKGGCNPFNAKENSKVKQVFYVDHIEMVKGRITSFENDTALGLDMLNELQKCPQALYDILSKDDKKLFRPSKTSAKTDLDHDINLMCRKDDRFRFLALRYIDSQNVLPGIAFQVSLGSFRYKFYNRKTITNNIADQVRIIQRGINGFGRMPKVEELRRQKYGTLIRRFEDSQEDTAQSKPYLTDRIAEYAITGNRIGMYWDEHDEQGEHKLSNDLCFLPNLPEPYQNNDGFWSVDKGDIGKNVVPRCWLSIYDLRDLVFLHELGGDPKSVIYDFYYGFHKLLNHILSVIDNPNNSQRKAFKGKSELDNWLKENTYHLASSQIPSKLLEFLLGETGGEDEGQRAQKAFKEWAKNKVDRELNDIKERLDKLNGPHKKEIKPGVVARYLAEDIMALQPPDPKKEHQGKLTGMDFAELQKALAQYSKSSNLGICLRNAEISESDQSSHPHPFLRKVMDMYPEDTLDLYRKYLTKKEQYLQDLQKKDSDDAYRSCHFLHHGRNYHAPRNTDYIRKLCRDYYPQNLQLPSGLFAEAIREKLKSVSRKAFPESLTNDSKTNGTSRLLNVYFNRILMDDSQLFYLSEGTQFKRHYELFDKMENSDQPTYKSDDEITQKLQRSTGKKSEVKVFLNNCQGQNATYRQNIQSLAAVCKKNEERIRLSKSQDMILFLMAKRLLVIGDYHIENDVDFKLKNIVPIGLSNQDSPNSILSRPIDYKQSFFLYDEKGKAIYDKSEQSKHISKTIFENNMQVKHYGEFFDFMFDTRIGLLLSQVEGEEFSKPDVQTELKDYDDSRVEFLKLFLHVETKLLANWRTEHSNSDNRTSFRRLLESVPTNALSAKEREHFIEIRNAVCHNRYPRNLASILEPEQLRVPGIANNLKEKVKAMGEKIL